MLAIARDIVEARDGTIRALGHEGGGAWVLVELPLAPD
jgi:K+-sensing histidine kinase KdpD